MSLPRTEDRPPRSAALPADPVAVPVRVVGFLLALVLVGGAGWMAGRVASPLLPAGPVPVLPVPAVLGGPGAPAHPVHEVGR